MYGLKEVDRLEVQKVRMPLKLYSLLLICLFISLTADMVDVLISITVTTSTFIRLEEMRWVHEMTGVNSRHSSPLILLSLTIRI